MNTDDRDILNSHDPAGTDMPASSQADGMQDHDMEEGGPRESEPLLRREHQNQRDVIGRLASDGLSKAREYLDDLDGEAMVRRAKKFLKDHPGAAVLGIVAVGFLFGRGLKRRA